jgi:cobalt/nickel transport protein
VITSLVILAIARTRPDLLETESSAGRSALSWEFFVFGSIVVLGLAIFVSPYACAWPDGLDKVAEKFGFDGRATTLIHSWIPDYKMPGISSEGIATAIAGVIGCIVMFGLACVIGRLLVRQKPETGPHANTNTNIYEN